MLTKNAFGYGQFKQYLDMELTRLNTLQQKVREKIEEVRKINDLPISTIAYIDIDKILTDIQESFKTESKSVEKPILNTALAKFAEATRAKQEVNNG